MAVFQENFDDDELSATELAASKRVPSIRRKPVGSAPVLPSMQLGNTKLNSSTNDLNLMMDDYDQARNGNKRPKGPRPMNNGNVVLPKTTGSSVAAAPDNVEYTYATTQPDELFDFETKLADSQHVRVERMSFQQARPSNAKTEHPQRRPQEPLPLPKYDMKYTYPSGPPSLEPTPSPTNQKAPRSPPKRKPVSRQGHREDTMSQEELRERAIEESMSKLSMNETPPSPHPPAPPPKPSMFDPTTTHQWKHRKAQSIDSPLPPLPHERHDDSDIASKHSPQPRPHHHRMSLQEFGKDLKKGVTSGKKRMSTVFSKQQQHEHNPIPEYEPEPAQSQLARKASDSSMNSAVSEDSAEEVYDEEEDQQFERNAIASGSMRLMNDKPKPFHNNSSKQSDIEPSKEHYWKYHIMKYSKDLYVTTNPDLSHLSRPVGPSYYIDVEIDEDDARFFTLVFNDQDSREPCMTVAKMRDAEASNQYYFAVHIHDKKLLAGTQLSSWSGKAVQIQSSVELPDGKSRPCNQFAIKDMFGSEWVAGNRPEFEMRNSDSGQRSMRLHVSTKVFFFLKGTYGPDSDKILAVYRRRQPKHKRIVRESLNWLSKEHRPHGNSLENTAKASFEDDSSSPPPPPPSSSSAAASTPSRVDDDDANNEKSGWLYILDTISEYSQEQPWVWPIVMGMVLGIAYSQRLDNKKGSRGHGGKEKTAKVLSNIKQKARDVRRSVYGAL